MAVILLCSLLLQFKSLKLTSITNRLRSGVSSSFPTLSTPSLVDTSYNIKDNTSYYLLRRKICSTCLLFVSFLSPLLQSPSTSLALEWTDRNRLAAEAWRTVDDIYVDRSFNGQDWFGLRQKVVKRTYQSDEQVYQALQDMLSKLGDRYTRYLTPAQYSALLSSTKGELVGIGVELGLEGMLRLKLIYFYCT